MVLTLCFSVLYGLLLRKILRELSRITEVERVYCAVRTESLYKTENFRQNFLSPTNAPFIKHIKC
jgi:hypothetical protein